MHLVSTDTVSRAGVLHAPDPWNGLRTLIRARLIVAVLALPVGLLLAPGAGTVAWEALIATLVAVGLLSVVYQLGVRIRRGMPRRPWPLPS